MNEQYGAGLQIDGIFGPASKRALIKGLQTELNAQYSAGLAVDGFWGPATKAACPEIGAKDWDVKAEDLANRFVKNFVKFTGNEEGKKLVAAGPKVK